MKLLTSTDMPRTASGDPIFPLGYPVWLGEGLADYITRLVTDELSIVEEGSFGTPTLGSADAVCAERARTPDGGTMLPFIGTAGKTQRRYSLRDGGSLRRRFTRVPCRYETSRGARWPSDAH